MSCLDLRPSKLGTKKHWDDVYREERANYSEFGDVGEIWFGEDSVEKMVEWVVKFVPFETHPSILEVGSGNGMLLFALVEAGYAPDAITGIDYSADAVELAQSIAPARGAEQISFAVCDFLKQDHPPLPHTTHENTNALWDLLLDKGTFDAIALAEKDENGKSPAVAYPAQVARSLKQDTGYFLITSCNFTEDELKDIFSTPETGLVYHSRIQHPTFTFGGKSGSVCSSVAFRKTCQMSTQPEGSPMPPRSPT